MPLSQDDLGRLVQGFPADPYFDDGLRGFIINTALKEYWRVSELCDLPDLVQDGVLCYWKCRQRYVTPRTDLTASNEERKWFQALVKTTYINHINSLSSKHKGVSERPASEFDAEGDEGPDVFERNLPPQEELGTLMALLSKAPIELLQLVNILAGDGAAAFARVRKGRRTVRETTNEYYCRLIGVDPTKRDVVEELRAYFG